jgi:hypothetical protein
MSLVASKKVLETVYTSKLIIESYSFQSVTRRDHSCKNVFHCKNSPDEKIVRNCEIALVYIRKNNREGMQVKTDNIE